MSEALIDVAAFDAVSAEAAAQLLRPVCASGAWIDAVVAGRPYASMDAVLTRSDDVLATLNRPGLEQALAAHPRIGDRPAGSDQEAVWSRLEQSGDDSDADTAAALREGNVAYEQRFDHVFLICATGRTKPEMLAALRERLGNEPDAEWEVVRAELIKIVRLRLAKVLR